ncbi:MAG: hypothetical protein K6F00_01915 [Lachnospiraceae bacterium]|nr:hypothetical protein [Lachnospiraceae bacterium]
MTEQSIEFRYDTQLLLDLTGMDEDDVEDLADEIQDYIVENFKGDELLCVPGDEIIKLHYHTNEPWLVLAYVRTHGEIYDIVVEDMDRQTRGLQG